MKTACDDPDQEVMEFPGWCGGILYTNGDGLSYRIHEKNPHYSTMKCRVSNCQGKGTLRLIDGCKVLKLTSSHSPHCKPEPDFPKITALRAKLIQRSKAENTKLSVIFKEECNKVPAHIAAKLNFKNCESTMYKARKQTNPPIPNTLVEYGELLHKFESKYGLVGGEQFFNDIIGNEGTESAIFINKKLINILEISQELHIDGTFKILPPKPQSRQLLTIMAISQDHAYPVVFALMKGRTVQAYDTLFIHLKMIFLDLSPKFIISDYESAIKVSVAKHFPTTKHIGCWFHFSQAILRKVQTLGLVNIYSISPNAKKIVGMMISLALLPEGMIEEGFQTIKMFSQSHELTPLEPLIMYFNDQWLKKVTPKSFSVYGQSRRTNNCQESFHNALFEQVGHAHPNIWTFTAALQAISESEIRNSLRANCGDPISRRRKRIWILQESQIKKKQEEVVQGRINLYEFLSAMSHRVPNNLCRTTSSDIDDDLTNLMSVDTPDLDIINIQETLSEDETNVAVGLPRHSSTNRRQIGARRARSGRGGRGRVAPNQRPGERFHPYRPSGTNENVNEVVAGNISETLKSYRWWPGGVIIPLDSLNDMLPAEFVIKQAEELQVCLQGDQEPTAEPENNDSSTLCLCCQTNKATRQAIPCGHLQSCRTCLTDLLLPRTFYVTGEGGSHVDTGVRLPVVCLVCRALVGQFIKPFL